MAADNRPDPRSRSSGRQRVLSAANTSAPGPAGVPVRCVSDPRYATTQWADLRKWCNPRARIDSGDSEEEFPDWPAATNWQKSRCWQAVRTTERDAQLYG